jgi:hypothetical protein
MFHLLSIPGLPVRKLPAPPCPGFAREKKGDCQTQSILPKRHRSISCGVNKKLHSQWWISTKKLNKSVHTLETFIVLPSAKNGWPVSIWSVRPHVAAFRLGDLSPGSQARTCPRTPKQGPLKS